MNNQPTQNLSGHLTPRESTIRTGLLARQKQVDSLLGDKIKSKKFIATAVTVANDNKLSQCSPESIIEACVNVAQLDLDLSPVLSHAYLVPFRQSVQLIVSVRGYRALLARDGWKLKSFIVNECDEFEYHINGFEETIKYVPNIDDEGEKVFRYAVAMALSPNNDLYVEIMNKSQVEKHRKKSNSQNSNTPSGVWAEWYEEMAQKTVSKKLCKTLPIGEKIAQAINMDDKPIDAEIVENKKEEKEVNSLNDLAPAHNKETGEIVEDKTPFDNDADLFSDIEVINGDR